MAEDGPDHGGIVCEMSKKAPAPDRNQLTMFPELARQIQPASTVAEPQVWFTELRLLKKLTAQEGTEDFIRKFRFRAGLNVLWAEPEPADSELRLSGLYADGFSGHATGKTLFCRILRYLLGDANFATKDDLGGIEGEFLELWAVAEIRLAGRFWVVGRALTGQGKDFAEPDATIDEVSEEEPRGDYAAFKNALESDLGSIVHNLYQPPDGWRHLLPWLTRDQEARFSAINAWRDSLSEADNPRATSERQHLLMRTVLNLLEQAEFDLRESLSKWDEEEKESLEKLPNKRSLAENDLRALQNTLGSVEGIRVELRDLDAALSKISNHIEVRKEALSKLQETPESPRVQAAREAFDRASQELTRAEDRIRYIEKTDLPAQEAEQAKTLAYIDQIKTKGIKDPTRVTQKYCPNSIQFAREQGCVDMPDRESQFEVSTLEADAKKIVERMAALKEEKSSLESKKVQLTSAKITALDTFNKIRSEENRESIKLERAVAVLENAEKQARRAIQSAEAVNELRSKKEKATREIEKAKKELATLKQETEGRLQKFSLIFCDVVSAILGASVSAWVEINERGLSLKAKRNGNLGGTALATIKTIAFDLAAVIQSIEGDGNHPRFFIHDGPREGDMARIIYGRLFLLARHIEEAFRGAPPSFQYILTTTTPPPADMREGSDWLVGEPMSGRDKSLKLLKRDY